MVGSSYDQKPYRRSMMQTWGATVHRSPSDLTDVGPRRRPRTRRARSGSRSPRPSRSPRSDEDTNYALGSVLNHVLLHQTVIGQEAIAQLELADALPGRDHRLRRRRLELRRASRSRSCAARCAARTRSATSPPSPPRARRSPAASTPTTSATPSGLTPLMPMYTLGHDFVPPPVHAGGLRYHGDCADGLRARQGGRGRGPRLPPERDVRGRGAVRPHRGDHPGARARARDPRGDRGGAGRQARRARSARSCSASAATATSTSPPTTPTWPARSRTRSSPRPTSSGARRAPQGAPAIA